jgi:hypothetical protein
MFSGHAAANGAAVYEHHGSVLYTFGPGIPEVKAIFAIARAQKIDVPSFLQDRFQVRRPDDLSLKQASEVEPTRAWWPWSGAPSG